MMAGFLTDAELYLTTQKEQTQSRNAQYAATRSTLIYIREPHQPLENQEIEEYADGDTFTTYLSHMIEQTVKDIPNFIRCPNPNCDSGQVHEGGDSRPLVVCADCNTEFCFRHRIPLQPQTPPSQHDKMTCDEYDQYLADPLHFRSDHQRQQERAAIERRELDVVQRARERMEKILQQRRDVEKKRRDEAAKEDRERRERAWLEEKRYEEEREMEEQERQARAGEIQRRKVEDEQSEKLIKVSTKACPKCAKRIEKNEGCMHMTCHCGHEFCWECTGPWVNNGCAICFGGSVVQFT
ncbi:hypothetical protein J7T55_004768 [Diaporthe amygdali]|uniref:uncharacterized protein n=1 Tax=Phomopsis amygdali TaxID=1214568 RepID=UPI0022FE8DC4|nr:uncharacterized protein J7T55_004768 [Diaporthe amygdali]KAJ0114525.1 hypothetical protein J7T55_004768 [Diaporthe amygdali]